MATHKIRVVVPPREGHPGTWAAGKLWTPANNETEVEVTDQELHNLASRAGIVVLQNGKPVRASAAPAARLHTMQLTADELRVVEEYRARKPESPQQQSAVQVKATGESVEDAEQRALAEASGGSFGGQSPLQDRSILMGQQTAGGHGLATEDTSAEQKPTSNNDLKSKNRK